MAKGAFLIEWAFGGSSEGCGRRRHPALRDQGEKLCVSERGRLAGGSGVGFSHTA